MTSTRMPTMRPFNWLLGAIPSLCRLTCSTAPCVQKVDLCLRSSTWNVLTQTLQVHLPCLQVISYDLWPMVMGFDGH